MGFKKSERKKGRLSKFVIRKHNAIAVRFTGLVNGTDNADTASKYPKDIVSVISASLVTSVCIVCGPIALLDELIMLIVRSVIRKKDFKSKMAARLFDSVFDPIGAWMEDNLKEKALRWKLEHSYELEYLYFKYAVFGYKYGHEDMEDDPELHKNNVKKLTSLRDEARSNQLAEYLSGIQK